MSVYTGANPERVFLSYNYLERSEKVWALRDADSIGQGRCSRQPARTAAKSAKCHSSRRREGRYTATSASRSIGDADRTVSNQTRPEQNR